MRTVALDRVRLARVRDLHLDPPLLIALRSRIFACSAHLFLHHEAIDVDLVRRHLSGNLFFISLRIGCLLTQSSSGRGRPYLRDVDVFFCDHNRFASLFVTCRKAKSKQQSDNEISADQHGALHQSEAAFFVKLFQEPGDGFTSGVPRLLNGSMEFLIRHAGREFGPYSEDEVRKRLVSGTIALSDPALATGTTEWKPLSSFEQFAPPPLPTATAKSPLSRNNLGAYTAATLQFDERPLHQTTIHWMALSGSVIGAFLSLIVIVPIAMFAAWRNFYWAWLMLVIPTGILLSAAITVRTSELVITDRRVLIKVGFIQRHTFEMFISKIESVGVFQSMLGRLFNYGTVEIRGTGGSSESFATIADPLPFRDAIQLVQSNSERG